MKKTKIFESILILLIFFSSFLRLINLRTNTQFEWDQENSVAFPAKTIIEEHHFPLIGPRTGVGDLHLPPLYAYLTVPFFYISGLDPVAGSVSAAFFSLAFLFVSFFLIYKNYDKKTATYFCAVWSFSTFILMGERIPSNLNLLSISSVLILMSTLSLFEKSQKRYWWFVMGLGLFLGINSHLSIVAILLASFSALFFRKKLSIISLLPLGMFFLGLLPLFIFNFRHENILGSNLINFIFNFSNLSGASVIIKAKLIFILLLENFGRIFIFEGSKWTQQILGLIFLISLFSLRKCSKKIADYWIYFFFLISGYVIIFTLYKEQIPEYYLLGILPVAVFGYVFLIEEMMKKWQRSSSVLLVLFLALLLRSTSFALYKDPKSLLAKQNIVAKIKSEAQDQLVTINYDMDPSWSYGYDYLLEYYKVNVKKVADFSQSYWISYPKERFPFRPDFLSGEIALGFPESSDKIYQTKKVDFYNSFSMRIPKEWMILQCPSFDFDKYILSSLIDRSCADEDFGREEVVIYNLPDCNIWETDGLKELETQSELPMYQLNQSSFSHIPEGIKLCDIEVVVSSIERNRCFVFDNLEYQNSGALQILNSIKK